MSLLNKRPNVLILFTDSQRFDTIRRAGYPHMITPNLDRLAEGGKLYKNAISSNPQCMPARHDMLCGVTGKYHGYNLNSNESIKDYNIPTIPRIFSENDYRTVAIGKMHFVPQRSHHGFDHIESMEEIAHCLPNDDYSLWLKKEGYGHVQNTHGIRSYIYHIPQQPQMGEEHNGNTWVANQALDWLEKNEDNPFLMMCSWINPHPPIAIPDEYREMYNGRDIPNPLPIQEQIGKYIDADGDGVDFVKEIRKSYYGSITMIDKNIGRILDYLEAKGELDNTLIIFTSDHGEMLGDGGRYYKDWPHEGSVRIPFIVRYPKLFKPGSFSDEYVDLLDVMPTCLDVCGLEYKSDKYKMYGESLARNPEKKDRTTHAFAHGTLEGYFKRYVCSRNQKYKYVYYYNGQEELYDIISDPSENNNFIGKGIISEEEYYQLKLIANEYEIENFPDGEYLPEKYIFSVNQENSSKKGSVSKYWRIYQYYYFWKNDKISRKDKFLEEFFHALKGHNVDDILRRVKKAYGNLPDNDNAKMVKEWMNYFDDEDISSIFHQ